MRARRAALAALLVATCGCRFGGVPAPEPLESDMTRDVVLRGARGVEPLLYRLAVAPPIIAFDPAKAPASNPAVHAAAPDADEFQRSTVAALSAARVFSRVAQRGAPGATAATVADAAWGANDDLLLELEVRAYRQEYLGHSNYAGWFIAYVSYIVPAWYIPVDFYGIGLEVRATLRSVSGGAPLLDETYSVSAEECKQELTPDDRELVGFVDCKALWDVEVSLTESNWQAIHRGVAPHAWRRFHLALLRDIEVKVCRPLRAPVAAEREATLRKVRKRFAVCAGVSAAADPRLGANPNAARDANAFAATLAAPSGGGLVPGKTALVVTNEAATKRGILAAIASVASRASATDEVIVYLAGLGTTVQGRPLLLPHDARADELASTGLALTELSRALDEVTAERVVVFLDASFAGRGSRTLQTSEVLTADAIAAALARPGRAVIAASKPGQAAHELPDADAGIFGSVVRAALAGAADADRDGRVTLPELFSFVLAAVHDRADMEGSAQEPSAYGLDTVELAWPR